MNFVYYPLMCCKNLEQYLTCRYVLNKYSLNKFQESKVSIKVTLSSCLPRQSLIKYLAIFKKEKVILTPNLGAPEPYGSLIYLNLCRQSLEEAMATHSSIPDWRILWTVETDRLQRVAKSHTWLKRLSIERIPRKKWHIISERQAFPQVFSNLSSLEK